MLTTLEAIIDKQGNVRLTEPIDLPAARRALVIILDEPAHDIPETATLSEQTLAEDWNKPKEDRAWSHLQGSAQKKYTRKQGQYLAFIHAYTQVHGYPPAETDLQSHFRVTPPTVHQMIVRLTEKGLIKRRPGQARTIEVLLPPEQLPELEQP